MKKILLCSLFVLLMMCVTPVGAYKAVGDSLDVINSAFLGDTYFNIFANDIATPYPMVYPEITEEPNHGFIYFDEDRMRMVYITNDPFYFGPDYFKYRVYDGHLWSNVAPVYLTVVHDPCALRIWLYTPTDTTLFCS